MSQRIASDGSEVYVTVTDGQTVITEAKNSDYSTNVYNEDGLIFDDRADDIAGQLETQSENADKVVIVSRTPEPESNDLLQEAIERTNIDSETDITLFSYEQYLDSKR